MKTAMRWITYLLVFLVISMPFTFAAQMNLVYDTNGNLITGDGFFRQYNSLNQLWKIYNGTNNSVLLQEFTYDPIEERVLSKKTYNTTGQIVETVYYLTNEFVQVRNTTGTFDFTYVYHEGVLIGQSVNGAKTYFAVDHKGNIVATMNNTGGLIEKNTYTPFGDIISGGNKSMYDYEGKETDTLTGQLDFNFRMYNPETGRFTQPDTLIQNVYDPQSLNRYTFERNNPYKYTDPTGHIGEEVVGGTIVGGLTLIFAPEVIIGIGLIVIGGLVIGYIINSNEAETAHENSDGTVQTYTGYGGKQYDSKEDWLDADLPRGGDIPFIDPDPKKRNGEKYKYDKEGNPEDADGRSWKWDKLHRDHWDVQNPNGGYTRVSPQGKNLGKIAAPPKPKPTGYWVNGKVVSQAEYEKKLAAARANSGKKGNI